MPALPVEPLFDRAEFWSVSVIDSCCLAATLANDSSGRWLRVNENTRRAAAATSAVVGEFVFVGRGDEG